MLLFAGNMTKFAQCQSKNVPEIHSFQDNTPCQSETCFRMAHVSERHATLRMAHVSEQHIQNLSFSMVPADLTHVPEIHSFQENIPCQSETCFRMAHVSEWHTTFRMAHVSRWHVQYLCFLFYGPH